MAVRRSFGTRVASFVLKSIFVLLIIGILGLLIWRFATSGDPTGIKTISVNDSLYQAYKTDTSISPYSQELASITRTDRAYGYFSVTRYIIIPEAHQIQIVFRYNNSTVRHTAEDYKLASVPDYQDPTLYNLSLVITNDKTPDDTTDNAAPEALDIQRYFPSRVIHESKSLYQFYRVTFENVDITDTTIGAFFDVYFRDDVHYEEDPYGSLCVYNYEMPKNPYKLTKNDLAALDAFKQLPTE